jgi:hypothetical protein
MAIGNCIHIQDIHRGINVNPEREDLFRDKFLASLREIGVSPARFGPGRLHDVIKLTFEAIQNVYDHADRKPFVRGSTAIISGFSLGLAEGGRSIRVHVSDSGVGIAGRQAQSLSVYEGDVEEEARLVGEAFASRGSAKLAAQDCRVRGSAGYGFTYITSYLGSLGADATLITGRLRFEFDRKAGGFARDSQHTDFTPGTTIDAVIPIGHH